MMNKFVFTRVNYQNILRQFQRTYRAEQEEKKGVFKTVVIATSLVAGAVGMNYYLSKNDFEERPSFFGKKDEKKEGKDNEPVKKQDVPITEKVAVKEIKATVKKKNLPKHVPYIIIGSGTSGLSAAKAIRASDSCSKVLLIGSSPRIDGGENSLIKTKDGESTQYYPPPYLRPPLSKQLWRRSRVKMQKLLDTEGDMRSHSWIYYEPESYYLDIESYEQATDGGVFLLNGDPVVELDTDNRTLTLASGSKISFDFCLLSTGAKPRRLTAIEKCSESECSLVNIGKVSYFRTLSDFHWLRDTAENMMTSGGKIAVIGGGFLGCEIACSLSSLQEGLRSKDPKIPKNLEVVHLFRETAPMSQTLPPVLASTINNFESQEKGIDIISSCDIVSARLLKDDKVRLRYRQRNIQDGSAKVEEIDVDHIVCAVGVEPNVDLAKSGSLEIDNNSGGFLVNAEMESRAGIYASGDVASYYDPVLGCRRRVEHLNFAEETGTIAGKNMAISRLKMNKNSLDKTYTEMDPFSANKFKYQSSSWSALGQGVSWDGVGVCDSRKLITKSFFAKTNIEKVPADKSDKGADSEPQLKDESEKDSKGTSLSLLENENQTKQGIVYYITPKERRIVGILLWNLDDDYFRDEEINPPSRLNMARKLLSEKITLPPGIDGDTKLIEITKRFDLAMKIDEDYEELKKISADVEKRLASEKKEEKKDMKT